MSDRLIRIEGRCRLNTLEDLLLVMAANIETSLISAGAIHKEDYTIVDLYTLAQPFALAIFSDATNGITFSEQ